MVGVLYYQPENGLLLCCVNIRQWEVSLKNLWSACSCWLLGGHPQLLADVHYTLVDARRHYIGFTLD